MQSHVGNKFVQQLNVEHDNGDVTVITYRIRNDGSEDCYCQDHNNDENWQGEIYDATPEQLANVKANGDVVLQPE